MKLRESIQTSFCLYGEENERMDKHDMFVTLMKQLGLNNHPEMARLLQTGEISEVTVHKQSHKYDFKLSVDELLDYEVFRTLEDALTVSFETIASVSLQIVSKEATVSDDNLQQYWLEAIQRSKVDSPLCNDLFKRSYPMLKDGEVVFYVENRILVDQMKEQFLPAIESAYRSLGFPAFTIHPLIDENKENEHYQAFSKRQEEMAVLNAKRAEESLKKKKEKKENSLPKNQPLVLGRKINSKDDIRTMAEITEEERSVTVEGYVFAVEIISLRSERKLLQVKITDYTSSFTVKKFSNNEEDEQKFEGIKEGMWLRVRGKVQEDTYMRDLVIMANDINEWGHESRKDTASEGDKRVELHLHSTMSMLDATNTVTEYVEQAKAWGQEAIAITDHGSVQAFPEAMKAGDANGVKIVYGLEANIVNDGEPIVYYPADVMIEDTEYVAFDVETTGLSSVYDRIIELSAVRFKEGKKIAEFEEFINPERPIPANITDLTGITDEMVSDADSEETVMKAFQVFIEGAVLIAHNASFDIGFVNNAFKNHQLSEISTPVVDTLELSRFLYPNLKSHRLNTLAKRFDVNLEHHHRAIFDSETTGKLCDIFLKDAKKKYDIKNIADLNNYTHREDAYKQARPFHAIILTKNLEGLKNLYKLESYSNVKYFYRVPRIPRSVLSKHRQGLIIGSACADGEILNTLIQKGYDETKKLAAFYDYLEIQPKQAYANLFADGQIKSDQHYEHLVQEMLKLSQEMDIPLVATGDVHYLNPEDAVYRKILLETQNPMNRGKTHPEVHFLSTNEMLAAFDFLGEKEAHEIVVTNSQKVAGWCEAIRPVKDTLYPPSIAGSEESIRDQSIAKAKELYGDPIPENVAARMKRELDSIISNGFAVIYLIAQKLVKKSNSDGYLVGSRGSVGSSLVATLLGITEVNPLPPHYHCLNCQYSEFFDGEDIKSGFDLPAKDCPKCGQPLARDGHNIPFETFLGFNGDKVPDIDLNFSGEYQPEAHRYTKVLFGEDHVFKAGTIGTIKDKTAFGYVKAQERETGAQYRNAEVDRLSKGLVGVKRTTGQHPGGIVVIPEDMDVYDFTPVQYPADDQKIEWQTTHFDFHSIDDNVLKLDILGHDDPTVLRMLQELTGVDPKTLPLSDPDVMKIFSGTEVLGVTPEQIGTPIGTLGVPEFGTPFVRQMLEQTQPKTFSDLLQISGLSHGTGVYLGNAEELIREREFTLADVIGCRDDIMNQLIGYGLDKSLSFKIMEHVRKGRGIPDEWQVTMRETGVPEWYIDSCLKIQYMFPKAHAAAYIIMALRIAYYKVHDPIKFYATYFSVRANDFDIVAMSKGKEAVKARLKEIKQKGNDASKKEQDLYTELEIANEMLERGYHFKMVDLEKSAASNFVIEGDNLIFPFRTVPSLGGKVAKQVVEARKEQPFLSKEDLSKRGGVSKSVIEFLDDNQVLGGLPDENQLSLF